jgi:serine kinase of HPr protein (carbohydrate metabolism regulator)
MHEEALIHGVCLAIGEAGVLLLGSPGAGKSDLALRLIDGAGTGLSGVARSARLVADDQVMVRKAGEALIASAPAALAGRLEIRGLGIAEVPHLAGVPLRLAVRLTPTAMIERLPEPEGMRMEILGISLPLVLIDPSAASATARIRAALDWFRLA